MYPWLDVWHIPSSITTIFLSIIYGSKVLPWHVYIFFCLHYLLRQGEGISISFLLCGCFT